MVLSDPDRLDGFPFFFFFFTPPPFLQNFYGLMRVPFFGGRFLDVLSLLVRSFFTVAPSGFFFFFFQVSHWDHRTSRRTFFFQGCASCSFYGLTVNRNLPTILKFSFPPDVFVWGPLFKTTGFSAVGLLGLKKPSSPFPFGPSPS